MKLSNDLNVALLEHIFHSLNVEIFNVHLLLLAEDEKGQHFAVCISYLSVILWMNIALKTGDLAPRMILWQLSRLFSHLKVKNCDLQSKKGLKMTWLWHHWTGRTGGGSQSQWRVSRGKSCCLALALAVLVLIAEHPSHQLWSRKEPLACHQGWSGCSAGPGGADWVFEILYGTCRDKLLVRKY